MIMFTLLSSDHARVNKRAVLLTDPHFSAAQQQSSYSVLNPSSFPRHNGPCEEKTSREDHSTVSFSLEEMSGENTCQTLKWGQWKHQKYMKLPSIKLSLLTSLFTEFNLLIGLLKLFLFRKIAVHIFENSAFRNPFIPAAKDKTS